MTVTIGFLFMLNLLIMALFGTAAETFSVREALIVVPNEPMGRARGNIDRDIILK